MDLRTIRRFVPDMNIRVAPENHKSKWKRMPQAGIVTTRFEVFFVYDIWDINCLYFKIVCNFLVSVYSAVT